jgi:hypothetical protein
MGVWFKNSRIITPIVRPGPEFNLLSDCAVVAATMANKANTVAAAGTGAARSLHHTTQSFITTAIVTAFSANLADIILATITSTSTTQRAAMIAMK